MCRESVTEHLQPSPKKSCLYEMPCLTSGLAIQGHKRSVVTSNVKLDVSEISSTYKEDSVLA